MSRKKTDKSDYILFANNINMLAKNNGGKYALADKIGVVYDSIRRWCNGENMPDGNQLLLIAKAFPDISLDWLLLDKDLATEFMTCWPKEAVAACKSLKKIIDAKHPVITPALLANIGAFEYSIDKESGQDTRIDKMEEENKKLKEEMSEIKDRLPAIGE